MMKKLSLKHIYKNHSFVRGMNVFLSAVIAANAVAINGYSVGKHSINRAIDGHPDRVIVNRTSGKIKHLITSDESSGGIDLIFMAYEKKTATGEEAYCLEHWIDAPDGDEYKKVSIETDRGMQHILYSNPGMATEQDNYYVKQMALNHYQGKLTFIEHAPKQGAEYREAALRLSAEAKKVYQGTLESPNIPQSPAFSVGLAGDKFTLEGDYYLTNWFSVGHAGNLKDYSVNVSNAPNGVQVLDKNGTPISSSAVLSSSDNKFRLRVPKTNVSKAYDNIQVDISANFDKPELVEYHPVDDSKSIQKVLVLSDAREVQKRSMSLKIDNPKGSLKVVKTNEKGERLQGAEFKLEKDGLVIHDNLVTDSNGEIVLNDLIMGSYKLIEKNAPQGYLMTGQSASGINVEIVGNAQTTQTVTNNIIQGRIGITKRDAELNDVKLEGVQFTVKDKSGAIVDTLVTDANGNATSKLLDYGEYVVEEVSTAPGYHLDSFRQNVNITENGKTYAYTVDNRIYKGNIHIVKIDSEDEETPVKGAGFDIIAKNVRGIAEGTVVEHIITDENGFAKTGNLRYGSYEIKEVTIPDGFLETNKTYPLDILEDGKTYVKYIKNDPVKMKLRVLKTDAKDNKSLQGVKFKIVNKDTGEDVVFKEYVDGKVIDKVEFTTDKNGEIITPQDLKAGNYQLVEVSTLEGYISIEPIDFVVNRNTATEYIETLGNVYTTSVANERIKGSMELLKVDMYTEEPMEGIEFEIECIEGFMKGEVFKLSTDKDGKINLDNLEYGKYKVTEIKTKENYVLDTEPSYFEIKENGDNAAIVIGNKIKEGYLEIEKIDAESKKPLEGVEFTIYNDLDEVVGVYTTDKDGKFKSDKLAYGAYKVKETKVLDGYIDNNVEIEFEILNDEEVISRVIENEQEKGDIFFQKVDSKTKEVLEGAKMKLVGTDDRNEHIEIEFESTKEGNEFRVPVGNYKITEEEAPKGYIKSILPRKVLVETGQRAEIDFENTKIPTSIGDILDKPTTGDSILMYIIMTILSATVLVLLNKDRFKSKNWEKYKR